MEHTINPEDSKNAKASYWTPFVKQWQESQESSKSFKVSNIFHLSHSGL